MKSVAYMSPLKSAKKTSLNLRFISLEAIGGKGKGEREENDVGGVTGETGVGAGGGDEDFVLSQSRKSRRRRFARPFFYSTRFSFYSFFFFFFGLLEKPILTVQKLCQKIKVQSSSYFLASVFGF